MNQIKSEKNTKIRTEKLNFYYAAQHVLKDITIDFFNNTVTGLIGPSGCGKSTFLRTLNRMNEFIENTHITGKVLLDEQDIYAKTINLMTLRKQIGMVFQKSNPFPKSIFKNISYGPKIHGEKNKQTLQGIVEHSLRQVGLWSEVKDKLHRSALELSGGQQQRLCIARALAVKPEVLLMDEPASALDPIATVRIEELILELKEHYTIIIVTHNLQQAGRISDYTAFFYLGELIESAPTENLFTNPKDKRTEAYITGRFG